MLISERSLLSPVKGQKHAGRAGSRHGEGGAQVIRAVAEHVRQGQLRAGEHHRDINIGQHEGHGRGGIGHGVGAVGDHDPVVACPILKNVPGNQLPFLRTDVGGIQTDHVLHGDVVIGTQLFQLPLHPLGAPGFQPFPAGNGRNGAAGGEKKDFFLCSHWRPRTTFWLRKPKNGGKISLPGQSATIIPSHGENSKKNNTPEEISRGADYNNQSAT